MTQLLLWLETFFSGALPFVLLLTVGLYLSIKTGFFQIRLFPTAMRHAMGGMLRSGEKGKLTPFRSACTALSATVGTGNIVGVATAISLGGAGAVFWMWVSAFVGMCVKSAEIGLSIRFRERRGNAFVGGPMYVIQNGIGEKAKPFAYAFAGAGLFAAFCGGAITQTNAVISVLQTGKSGNALFGICFALLCVIVLSDSGKKIGALNEFLVPAMALFYIFLSVSVIISGKEKLPETLLSIIRGAFCPSSVTGGVVGSAFSAIIIGASRGVFSNEAGLGTSGMAHAASEGAFDGNQALYGIFEVFVDTVLICTLTALTILCGGVKIDYGTIAAGELVRAAFSSVFGQSAAILLAGMMCLFSFSSVIGWGFYGKICLQFLAGGKETFWFSALYSIFCVVGAIFSADTAWRLAAFSTGIMLLINVTTMMVLHGMAAEELKKIKGGTNFEKKNRTVADTVEDR